MSEFTETEKAYIDYLNELYDNPNYGLLFYKGDPTAFQVGLREWYENLTEEDKFSLGLTHELPMNEYTIKATKTIYSTLPSYDQTDAEDEFFRGEENGIYEEEWKECTPELEITDVSSAETQKSEDKRFTIKDRQEFHYHVEFSLPEEARQFLIFMEKIGHKISDFVFYDSKYRNGETWLDANTLFQSEYSEERKDYLVEVLVSHIYKPVKLKVTAFSEEEAKEKAEELAKDRNFLRIQSTETEVVSVTQDITYVFQLQRPYGRIHG